MKELEFHPVAELFPLLPEKELAALADDIKANGLIEPIWLHQDGRIVDGRNRYRACISAAVEPRCRTWDGAGSLTTFVIGLNLRRRHLDESQRAMVAARAKPMFEAEAKERQATSTGGVHPQLVANLPEAEKGRSRDAAAELVNVSPRSVESASKVLKGGSSELVAAVDSGAVAVSTAATLTELPKARQVEIVAKGEREILAKAKEIKTQQAEQRKQKQIEREQAALDSAPSLGVPWIITGDQSVVVCDALITDPPYGILAESWEPNDLENFTRDWASRWAKCGADVLAVFWSQRYLFDGRKWLDESLSGYQFQQLLVWHYPNNKSPQSRQGFKQTWEPIFFYRRIGSSRNVGVSGAVWGDGLNDFDCHVAAVPQSNFNDENFKQHPAQKPVSVMRWLVNALTAPNELVCDPFCGSGTTGIAAVQLGRRFHGVETDPQYSELSQRRIAAHGASAVRAA